MGIQGLLPLLTKIQKKVNLKDFAGQRIAVDGNVWLHRGAIACAQELALNQPTTAYITYFMNQVELLRHHRVDPVIVFDGDSLPIKKHTNDLRRKKREIARDKAMNHLRLGELDSAVENFQKAIRITPQMTNEVIKVLKSKNVKFIHAPYEADPQLTWLCKSGMVSAVLTEDSDMLVFGCPTVLFKLDANGDAIQIHYQDLFTNLGNGYDLSTWDTSTFRHMCILSGCDYLSSISGVGLKTAYNLMTRHKSIEKVMPFLQSLSRDTPPSYALDFYKANDAFLYQYVYTPKSKSCIPMTKLPPTKTMAADYGFLGASPNTKKQPSKVLSSQPLGGRENLVIGAKPKPESLADNSINKYPGKENIPPSYLGTSQSTSTHRLVPLSTGLRLGRATNIIGKRKLFQDHRQTGSDYNKRPKVSSPPHQSHQSHTGTESSPINSTTANTTPIEDEISYVIKWGNTRCQGARRQLPTLEPTNRLFTDKTRNVP